MLFRSNGQSFGCTYKISFVICQKFKYSGQRRWLFQCMTQCCRVKAGKRKKACSAVAIFQDPAKRCQRQYLWRLIQLCGG